MLSPMSRMLTRVLAVLFAVLGAVLFLAPDWANANFLWKTSPFVAMTIGGWYLGSAVMAWEGARQWQWSVTYPRLLYVWSFGLLEAGALALHGAVIRWDALFVVPYIAVLAVAVLTAIVGIADWLRLRPAIEPLGVPTPGWVRLGILGFVLFVGFLATVAALGPRGATNGAVFPEALTLLTVRGFGAFYLSLGLAALPLLWARGMQPVLALAWAGCALVIPIEIAALVNLDKFNLAAHPLGLLYLAAYLVALIGAVVDIAWERNERERRAGRAAERAPVANA